MGKKRITIGKGFIVLHGTSKGKPTTFQIGQKFYNQVKRAMNTSLKKK